MSYSLPFKPTDKVIELGGGDNPAFPENVDMRPGPKVTLVADLNEPLPIESESYDGVFSKFLLEHIRLPKLRGFISEIHRILKPEGIAVIVTSNLLEMARVLTEREQWNDDLIYMVFGGDPDESWNYHHSSLSPEYAVRLFMEVGFHRVEIFEWPPSKAIWGRATEMIIQAHKSGVRIVR